MKSGAVIVAAGEGKRLGVDIPKAFFLLGDKPLYQYSLSVFQEHPAIEDIVLVVPPAHADLSLKGVTVVGGGATRQESVWKGMKALKKSCDWVLVHDAARPFLTKELIDKLLNEARQNRNAIAAHPVADTIKMVESGRILKTVDRKNLWGAETPQLCKISDLQKAFETAEKENWTATDEASLLEKMGIPVFVVESDSLNIKITTKKDLSFAVTLLKEKKS